MTIKEYKFEQLMKMLDASHMGLDITGAVEGVKSAVVVKYQDRTELIVSAMDSSVRVVSGPSCGGNCYQTVRDLLNRYNKQ